MKCPKCQTENLDSKKFCRKCGNTLALICPHCSSEYLPGDEFCGDCGHQLTQPPRLDSSRPSSYTPKHLADQILTSRSALEGERKLVTVLFADVASFTTLSDKLDPEEVHQIMDGCFKILMDEIHRYEGTINQFTGDGVMALFGAPLSHEDHAQRACHAALAIQKSLASYQEKLKKQHGIDFQLRIGLNSGPVVVGKIGDDLRMDYTAIGDTTNLASRMQSLAKPGTILASAYTYRLAQDFFQFQSQGVLPVKGKEEAQEAYQLLQTSKIETRIAAATARGLTKFVGRTKEIQTLQEAYEKAQSGSGQVVGIVGEAGVGKSRLLLEFRQSLSGEFLFLEGRCLHYGGSMVHLPFLDILRSYFDIKEGDREVLIKKKLAEKISSLDLALQSLLPPLQELLSLKIEDEAYLHLEPRQKKERTFEALRDLFLRESQNRPLFLVLEDLHWIDKTSEEFLGYLIDSLAKARILLMLLYRPEYTHSWGSKSYYSKIGLDQLSLKASTELVQAILEGGEVASDLRQLILDRATGNPLFMEELAHSLLENGSILKQDHQYVLAQKTSQTQVPDTIQGVIAARMDRLQENLKRTLQMASVIGRDFAFRILHAITSMQEDMKDHLRHLQGLEFIYEKSLFPELEYIFKHALTQEVAYNSLLLKRRKEIHERIGLVIEEIYPERLQEFYEVLAYHFEKAGIAEKAVKYLHLAGERASRLSANEQAISRLNRGLEILQTLPESATRDEQELALRLALAAPLQTIRGYAAPELGQSHARALELCRQMGESPQIIPALWLLWNFNLLRSGHHRCLELTERLLTVAQHGQDPLQIAMARWARGVSLLYVGEFKTSLSHLEHVIDFYDIQQHGSLAFTYGQDPGVSCLAWAACALWFLGYPDRALKRSQDSVALGRKLDHTFTLAFVLHIGGSFFHLLRREHQDAQDYTDSVLNVATERGLPFFRRLGPLNKEIGQSEEAIDQMQQGIMWMRSIGHRWATAFYLSRLAESYGLLGQAGKGLTAMEEALSFVEETGERIWEAELRRVKGELLQSSGRIAEAEACLRQAIEVARRQEAKSWELRATLSLSRLFQKEGRSKEARQLLSEIYNWFTEGFDTPDLQDARALLEELGSQQTGRRLG